MLDLERKISHIKSQQDQELFIGRLDLAYPSKNSRIYRFWSDTNNPFLLKIIRPNSRHDREIGGTLSEKLDQLKILNILLKRYYGPSFVSSDYFLLDQLVPPQIASVRPEILGTPADQLPQFSGAKLEAFTRKLRWEDLWFELTSDRQFSELQPITKKALLCPDFSLGNIIYVDPDSYFIIDW